QDPRERYLRWRCIEAFGNSQEPFALEEPALLDRRVGDYWNPALAAPGHQREFDAAARQVIEHLIGRDGIAAVKRAEFFEVCDVEITHTPVADLAVLNKRAEPRHRFLERDILAPMQQVQVEAIGSEPPKTS